MLKTIIQLLPKKVPDFLNFSFLVAIKKQQEKSHSDRMDNDGEDRFEDFDERERNWR